MSEANALAAAASASAAAAAAAADDVATSRQDLPISWQFAASSSATVADVSAASCVIMIF